MSIFAILYSSDEMSPEAAIERLFPHHKSAAATFQCTELDARASRVTTPNFLIEEYGISPKVKVYFELNKLLAGDARRTLGAAIRSFVASASQDLLLLYCDIPVLRRSREGSVYARDYGDFKVADSDPVDVVTTNAGHETGQGNP